MSKPQGLDGRGVMLKSTEHETLQTTEQEKGVEKFKCESPFTYSVGNETEGFAHWQRGVLFVIIARTRA